MLRFFILLYVQVTANVKGGTGSLMEFASVHKSRSNDVGCFFNIVMISSSCQGYLIHRDWISSGIEFNRQNATYRLPWYVADYVQHTSYTSHCLSTFQRQ
jgi:hypothetical protein